MFDFFKSCIVVVCNNYFRTIINVSLKQQLCCNKFTMYVHMIMLRVHISTAHYGIHLQLVSIMIPIDTISTTTIDALPSSLIDSNVSMK
jgi:hypothetical protein